MKLLHMYADMIAIGDAAFSICRAYAAMQAGGYDKIVIHTQSAINIGGTLIPNSSASLELFRRTSFVAEVLEDADTLYWSSGGVRLEHPLIYRPHNNIKDWINLDDLTPDVPASGRVAVFQPISLRMKPREHLNDYIPVWTKCLETLFAKNYHVVMVAAPDDPIDLCVDPRLMSSLDNRIGKWSILQSLAFTLNRADVILSCDSWAGVWGIASRKPTAIAWGYRMEHGLDGWVMDFLGNKDVFKHGWSSKKNECDAVLAEFLATQP